MKLKYILRNIFKYWKFIKYNFKYIVIIINKNNKILL